MCRAWVLAGQVWKPFTFTFTHLADAFIQSDLHCIQAIHVLSLCVFPGNRTHNLCAANAMLYHSATEHCETTGLESWTRNLKVASSSLRSGRNCRLGGVNVQLSTLNTTTEVPLSKALNPQLLPGRRSIKMAAHCSGYVFTVCVCSLLSPLFFFYFI